MEYAEFAALGTRASLIGFGCAPMGSRYGERESLRALGAAYDLGVNYFDVARAYGHGDAERILGRFIRGRRERVIVATKFGMEAPRVTTTRRLIKAVARQAFRIAPGLRLAARRQLGSQFTRHHFDVPGMTRSVEESLRQLQTDRIDVLLIHDCTRDALDSDDLFDALQALITHGKVRSIGISGDRSIVEAGIRARPQIGVVQFQHDLFQPPIHEDLRSSPRLGCVAFHPFGGEAGIKRLRNVVQTLRNDPATPAELRNKLQDTADPDIIGTVGLLGARVEGGLSVLLTTMFTARHIEANARAVSSSIFTADEVAYFRATARQVAGQQL